MFLVIRNVFHVTCKQFILLFYLSFTSLRLSLTLGLLIEMLGYGLSVFVSFMCNYPLRSVFVFYLFYLCVFMSLIDRYHTLCWEGQYYPQIPIIFGFVQFPAFKLQPAEGIYSSRVLNFTQFCVFSILYCTKLKVHNNYIIP